MDDLPLVKGTDGADGTLDGTQVNYLASAFS